VTNGQGGTVSGAIEPSPQPDEAPRIDSAPANALSAKSGPGDIGLALRNAFQAAVDEDVPQELLDLLRRLD